MKKPSKRRKKLPLAQASTPEVGDQVMVGFRYNDPNRPFVMRSLFNGTTAAGGQDQNNYKSITTRSGHTILFNDTHKKESITIKDRNDNTIFIDTSKNNIEIIAGETMTFRAKNIAMLAEENIDMQAKGNISTASEGDTNVLVQDATSVQTEGDISLKSNASLNVEASTDAIIQGQNVISERMP